MNKVNSFASSEAVVAITGAPETRLFFRAPTAETTRKKKKKKKKRFKDQMRSHLWTFSRLIAVMTKRKEEEHQVAEAEAQAQGNVAGVVFFPGCRYFGR